jgi:threonine aldolase
LRAVDWVELRSDTFTSPTPAMRRAMAEAEVGDDVWGEDPTANALQEECAALFGKEAGLFVPSGSMGNEVSIKALTEPGDAIIVEARAHVVEHELGAPGAISGVLVREVGSNRGTMDPAEVSAKIGAPTPRYTGFSSAVTLICMENTHGGHGGAVVPLAAMKAVAKVAKEKGCAVFLDGARIFNASVASGVSVADYTASADVLSFCFSKGLGAPIGSMILGPAEVVSKARWIRKMLGGGMRQVGILCAAAKIALDTGVDRLADDHANARRLAEGFAEALPGSLDPDLVETNIVFCDTPGHEAAAVAGAMWSEGVRVAPIGPSTFRAATHRDVDAAGIERAIKAFAAAVRD